MKRSLLTGGIGAAVLAVAIPAGAIIQNQVSRPSTDEPPAPVVIDESATTLGEPTTTVAHTEPPVTTEPKPVVTEPAPTTTEPKPEPTRPKPEYVIRLDCAAKVADSGDVNVCHWTDPATDGVRGYKVWRSGPGTEQRQVIGVTDGHEWSDRNVKPGNKYSYVVEAVGEGVSFGFSNVVTVEDPLPPAVLKLWCSPKFSEAKWVVVCEWSALNRDGVAAYQLWRRIGDGTKQLIATIPSTANRRNVDTDVSAGQGITYIVVAVNGDDQPLLASDGVRVVIPNEAPTTTVKPVETTEPTVTAPK